MVLQKLKVKNFRILNDLELKPHPKINIIHGLNGQGKTSILEAIYYLSITKSFRAKNDKIVLNSDSQFFDVDGLFSDTNNVLRETRVFFSKSDGKHIFLDKTKLNFYSHAIGILPVVLLSLEDLELTFGVPAARRKFLDVLLSQLYPKYLTNLQRYKKSVLQKNKMLNRNNGIHNHEELFAWNEQICEYGSQLIIQRQKFIKFLNERIENIYNEIAKKNERISILYHSLTQDIENTAEVIKEKISEMLQKFQETEIKRQTSLIGPHRDDIEFLKNGYAFKTHGSQGENKSFLIALKIIESQYIYDVSSKKPLLLLDDIFSELDFNRIKNLINIFDKQGQIFITTTDEKQFKKTIKNDCKYVYLKNETIQ